MAFALRLLRINFYNTYYRAKACDDFILVPTEESQRWMQRCGMKLVTGPGCFEIYWKTGNMASPLQTLQKKTIGENLTFHLKLKNPHALCFSALSISSGEIYHFHNQRGSVRLHQEDYASQADKISVQEITSYRYKLDRTFFGMVDIHWEELWKGASLTEHELPVTYEVNVKARETIWRYCVVDKNSRVKNSMKVVLDNEDVYFNSEINAKSDAADMRVYESKQPIALVDKPERFFSLKTCKEDEPNVFAETIIEKLPVPTDASLKRAKKSPKLLYNDIFVYV